MSKQVNIQDNFLDFLGRSFAPNVTEKEKLGQELPRGVWLMLHAMTPGTEATKSKEVTVCGTEAAN